MTMLILEIQFVTSPLKFHHLKVYQKKQSKKGSQKSSLVSQEEAWFSNQNILMAKFLQSCNESQEDKSEDDLFGQIVAKSLSKISNWRIKAQ